MTSCLLCWVKLDDTAVVVNGDTLHAHLACAHVQAGSGREVKQQRGLIQPVNVNVTCSRKNTCRNMKKRVATQHTGTSQAMNGQHHPCIFYDWKSTITTRLHQNEVAPGFWTAVDPESTQRIRALSRNGWLLIN